MERSRGLNDEEHAAVVALQQGAAAPSPYGSVWAYRLAIGLIWIDWRPHPPVVGLTPDGRDYSTG